jgi:hypothetical protein
LTVKDFKTVLIQRVYVYACTFAILIKLALSQGCTCGNTSGSELRAASQSELVYQRDKTIVQLGLEYGPIRFYSLYQVTPTLVNASLVQ